jgi:hypothetical protein
MFKHPLDWYVKWIGSTYVLIAIVIRTSNVISYEAHVLDLLFSFLGASCWLWVSFQWKDRAMIVMNTCVWILLSSGLITALLGGAP